MGLCVKAWTGVQTLLLHPASRPVLFQVEVKRRGQATLQVLPSWLQSPRHGMALRWDSRERNNLTFAPCWFSACRDPDGASGQRRRGSYLSSRSPAPPGAFLFLLGTTSLGALGRTGQEQGQTSGLQGYHSGCCLQKATEKEREREKRQVMCASHMFSTRLDNLDLAGRSHSLKQFNCPTLGHRVQLSRNWAVPPQFQEDQTGRF